MYCCNIFPFSEVDDDEFFVINNSVEIKFKLNKCLQGYTKGTPKMVEKAVSLDNRNMSNQQLNSLPVDPTRSEKDDSETIQNSTNGSHFSIMPPSLTQHH